MPRLTPSEQFHITSLAHEIARRKAKDVEQLWRNEVGAHKLTPITEFPEYKQLETYLENLGDDS